MILSLLACTSPSRDSAPALAEDTGWPQVDLQNPVELQPGWSAGQAGLAFQSALEGPYPDVRVIGATYLEWIARGDELCPGGDSLQPPAVSLEGCTSSSGVHYAGLSGWSEDTDRWGLQVADFRLTDPEGRSFLAGGEAVVSDGGGSSYLLLRGSFHDTGAAGWLGQGGSALLQVIGSQAGMIAQIGMSTPAGPLYTDELLVGSACMEGEVFLKGLEGGWYDLNLDCGCGPVRFGAQELGEVCLDDEPIRAALQEAL